MQLSRIKLFHVRSYDLYETPLSAAGTIIVGENGTGKTNLLESVYTTMQGTSFRGSLADMVRHHETRMVIHADFSDNTSRRLSLVKTPTSLQKEFIVNDKKSKILAKKQRLPVVLFEPNELRLISSSPSRRRDFLDGLMARLNPQYDTTLRAYNRALLQRNELLKNYRDTAAWRDHLFAWDIKYVQLAARIVQERINFLYNHADMLGELYASLAGKMTPFSIRYLSNVPPQTYEQTLLAKLEQARPLDIATGHTSLGPHREDFTIFLHHQPAIKVASRGEMRTIMLAFKLLELQLQTEIFQTRPLILMDDVFSELDSTREKLLQETIWRHQFIVTTTDSRHLRDDCMIITTSAT